MFDTTARETDELLDDQALIDLARDGSLEAQGTLFRRHRESALRIARKLAGPDRADDIVAESFAHVFGAIVRGNGPKVAFRAYLHVAVRHQAVDLFRAESRYLLVDDFSDSSHEPTVGDLIDEIDESTLLAAAFRSLPERWQVVLWHSAVEGENLTEIAPRLGLTANAVAALGFRGPRGPPPGVPGPARPAHRRRGVRGRAVPTARLRPRTARQPFPPDRQTASRHLPGVRRGRGRDGRDVEPAGGPHGARRGRDRRRRGDRSGPRGRLRGEGRGGRQGDGGLGGRHHRRGGDRDGGGRAVGPGAPGRAAVGHGPHRRGCTPDHPCHP
ncbi:Sigma-70 region 2 [Aeromicrobium marinum DSM 15272]|uniref:Sigma-70 region 2 n=1 Tax=Aeromicrobium marinum DSM 15272 TaxID=585531 RepID=E2SDE9_9ACTN|nr:Sigma-70 region 2 [Aeromicrobium marinum DSM 15272]